MKVYTDKEFTLASTDNTSETPFTQAKLDFTSPVEKVTLKKWLQVRLQEEMLPLRNVEWFDVMFNLKLMHILFGN